MGLQEFKLRLSERTGIAVQMLSKSVHPADFAGILHETDEKGNHVVDHTKDLTAHPPSSNARVEHYNKAISGQMPLMRRTTSRLVGLSAKVLYLLPAAGKLPDADKYIVKPYHEVIHDRAKFWQHHLIQGWAEMTNQSLWHAAGMGDMHQKVHVAEHAMGMGHEKEPAIVIKMEPGANFSRHLTAQDYAPYMHNELPKIAAMDFLSNNLDRHVANLLFLPAGATDDNGAPLQNRILAIDHGRSFQYHASNKGAPKFIEDPFHGRIAVDEAERRAFESEGKTKDNLMSYLNAPGLREFNRWGITYGMPSILSPRGIMPSIAEWWPRVKDKVQQAFAARLDGLREVRLRDHMQRNFMERVKILDSIAANPQWWLTRAKTKDLDVPLHVWDRDSHEDHHS
jgi:hypothetical protein